MTDEPRRLSRAEILMLVGQDEVFARHPEQLQVLGLPLAVDPSLPPGVIEIRNGDRVLGRIFAGGA